MGCFGDFGCCSGDFGDFGSFGDWVFIGIVLGSEVGNKFGCVFGGVRWNWVVGWIGVEVGEISGFGSELVGIFSRGICQLR